MKKYFYLLMLALMPMCFTACGGDDETGTGSSWIVGDWKCVGGDDNASVGKIISFYADGTYQSSNSSSLKKWRLSGSKLYISKADGSKTDEYIVEYKNNQLHMTFPDGSATEYTIYEKVVSSDFLETITSSYFVGTWSGTGSAYGTWKFSSNGNCTFSFTGGGNKSYSNSGTWTYDPTTKTLTTSLQSWEWTIYTASENEWSTKDGKVYTRVK